MARITNTSAYLAQLWGLIEHAEILEKHGYISQPLTDENLLLKRRCLMCKKAMSQCVPKANKCSNKVIPTLTADEAITTIACSTLLFDETPLSPIGPVDPKTTPAFRCKYHPGQVVEKHWTCCSQHVTAKPCGGSNTHNFRLCSLSELAEQHQFHLTPDVPYRRMDVRAAVALDCEMGTAASGDSELIRVTLINYFSGAVLVNNIVEPDVPMQHLNTRFSGVTWADLKKARKQGKCLRGKAGARQALWRYVGPDIVVVGHGVANDLRALRWIHELVVDSFVTEFGYMKRRDAEHGDEKIIRADEGNETTDKITDLLKEDLAPGNDGFEGTSAVHMSGQTTNEPENENPTKTPKKKRGGPGHLSLKRLVKERLDRDIQMGGRLGHDSLEDAIAARDLVHWIITHPERA